MTKSCHHEVPVETFEPFSPQNRPCNRYSLAPFLNIPYRYTASSKFSSARRIILHSFEHTGRLSIDETNDRILYSFRSVIIEFPIPNSRAILVAFSSLASLSSMHNLFSKDKTTCLQFLLDEAAIFTAV